MFPPLAGVGQHEPFPPQLEKRWLFLLPAMSTSTRCGEVNVFVAESSPRTAPPRLRNVRPNDSCGLLLIRPVAQCAAGRDELADVVGVVIRHEDQLAQIALP